METIEKYLCTKSHGEYLKGHIYKCLHESYSYVCSKDPDSNYYQMYYGNTSTHYAEPGKDFCDLNLFKFVQISIKLDKIEKVIIEKSDLFKFINNLFKLHKETSHETGTFKVRKFEYHVNGYTKGQVIFINENIIDLINKIKLCDKNLFEMHQDKIHYVLLNVCKLPGVYKAANIEMDTTIDERLIKYSSIITKIYISITNWEKKAKTKNDIASKLQMESYMEEQDVLLSGWEENLDEVWK